MNCFRKNVVTLSVPPLRNVPTSGNNHFQERNSPQTEIKLRELYHGDFGKYWEVEPK